MDRVKKYWQSVIKEREVFWSSFFKKYEEDNKQDDVDVSSYINNSTSRIDNLFKLAATEEEGNEVQTDSKVLTYFEEQSSESPGSNISSANIINNETPAVEELKKEDSEQHTIPLFKKKIPAFIVEIVAEDEDAVNKLRNLKQGKKLKLFESHSQIDDSKGDSVRDCLSETSAENLTSTSLNESNISSVSLLGGGSVKYVCRRVKSRSKQMSAPKRFKLM